MYLEIEDKIMKLLHNFGDFQITKIYSSFDEQSNLNLNIDILSDNKVYSITKTLKFWTIEDLYQLFEFSISDNKYITIQKSKPSKIKEIIFPEFILFKDKKLEIVKVVGYAFSEQIKEFDFSNLSSIELDRFWVNHYIHKLIINISSNNLHSVINTDINQLWINKLESIDNEYNFHKTNELLLNNKISNNETKKILNDFSLFSEHKSNDVSINFSYVNTKSIQINWISSNNIIENFRLFNFLLVDNKALNIVKWKTKSLSRLKTKIIDCSKVILDNKSLFENNEYIEKVILSSNQHKLPMNIFRNCTNLEEIENTKSIIFIEEYALDNCKNLKYFYISKNIKFIHKLAFINLDGENTRIIYHKENNQVVKNILYKQNLEEIINIDELAEFSFFKLLDDFIEIESFNHTSKIITSSFVEYKNKIYPIKKINYHFLNYDEPIKIKVPWFTEFISFDNLSHDISQLILPKHFKLNNIFTYPIRRIEKLILPVDTEGLKLNSYCYNLTFRSYSDVYNFNYDGKLIGKYNWELPIINNEFILKIKLNKWSKYFKDNSSLNLINRFQNNLIIPFLNEIKKYKKEIKLINIF